MIYYVIYKMTEFEITIAEKEGNVIQLSFGRCEKPEWTEKRTDLLAEAEKQLEEYFNGKRTEFRLPLAPEGTDFHMY